MMKPNSSSPPSSFWYRYESLAPKWNDQNPQKKAPGPGHEIPILCIEDLQQISPNAPTLEAPILALEDLHPIPALQDAPVVSPYFRNSKSAQPQQPVVSPYFQTKTSRLGVKRASPSTRQRVVSRFFQTSEKAEVTEQPKQCARVRKQRDKSSAAPTRTTLSSSQLCLEAYRRKRFEDTWKPPPSGVRLLQQDHAFDPWRVLVICMLLNRTTGHQAKQVIPKLFTLCPNPKATLEVSQQQIEDVIRPLGLQRKRSRTMHHLSEMYLKDTWTHVTQLPGVGKYGADAHAIFCTGYWTQLLPKDHMLNYYWEFLHSIRHLL